MLPIPLLRFAAATRASREPSGESVDGALSLLDLVSPGQPQGQGTVVPPGLCGAGRALGLPEPCGVGSAVGWPEPCGVGRTVGWPEPCGVGRTVGWPERCDGVGAGRGREDSGVAVRVAAVQYAVTLAAPPAAAASLSKATACCLRVPCALACAHAVH